jgi:hypothetical protein
VLSGQEEEAMTPSEEELVAALESDIQTWEFVARFFEQSVPEFGVIEGKKMSGTDYALSLHRRIAEHRALVERVKRG